MLITLLFAELSSVALGGRIVAVSDEFFAEAFHLLLVEVDMISYYPVLVLKFV